MSRRKRLRNNKLPRDQANTPRPPLRRPPASAQDQPSAAEILREEGRQRFKRYRRIAIVMFLIALVVAIISEFTVPKRQPPPEPTPVVYIWDPAPTFGDEAQPPPGTTEVSDSGLAPLDGLAEGSALARGAQVAVATDHQYPIEIENAVGMRFRLVPHGSFIMGSPDNEPKRGPDEPETAVMISQPFYLGKYEVTRREWELVMGVGSDPSTQKTGPNYPVEDVSWNDIQAFIETLCAQEGLPSWAYRLPTEAEWEYACRAGTQTPYYFGNQASSLEEFANYRYGIPKGKQAVGRKRPNAFGLYNLHGNIWEWCDDLFYYYDNPGITDPIRRVIRGGHYYAEAGDCRSASRFRLPPDSNSNLLGFRLVRSIVKPPEQLPHKQPKPW